MNKIIISSLLFLGISCSFKTPLKGPGVKAISSDSVYLGISCVVLKKNRSKKKSFWKYVNALSDKMLSYDGLVGYQLARDVFTDTAHTVTYWEDPESMKKFVYSDLHQRAIDKGWAAVKYGRFTKKSIPRSSYPLNWSEIRKLSLNDYYEIPHYE